MTELGRLKEVDLRNIWKHEQYDFSAWLSQEENINELGSTLDLTLTDIETEKFVGEYRCDILCKDETTGKTVLIENQLEPTNHDHLGKILTYASGLDAGVIIWIVQRARPEHKSAIDRLNEHTDDGIAFFLIEIHAYKIGDSKPAPYFKIIAQPNEFVRTVREISHDGNLRDSHVSRLEFWSMLNEIIDERGKPFNKQKPSKNNWFTVSVGSSLCHISIDLVNTEHRIRIRFWIPDSKELFDKLYENKVEIEKSFGKELIRDRMDDKKASSIHMYIDGLDFNNKENYQELMNKSIDEVIAMKKAFKTYL